MWGLKASSNAHKAKTGEGTTAKRALVRPPGPAAALIAAFPAQTTRRPAADKAAQQTMAARPDR
ncbi:hypothetical protein GCM10022205_51060 [Spinactinospora alkalitolerans]